MFAEVPYVSKEGKQNAARGIGVIGGLFGAIFGGIAWPPQGLTGT